MASSSAELNGLCPIPFLQEDKFPTTGGFIPGRFCMPIPSGNFSCCLPCPMTHWTYSDGFEQRTEIANWVNVVALISSTFLLLSLVFLPVRWTHRHYLSICLTIGVAFIELGFIVPLASDPPQCHNEITPNDMHSNATCAVSGAMVMFGGWAAVLWVFCRALSLHLQICWEVIPGPKFFYSAQFFGWGIPAVVLAIALSLTGVSFRFGNVCHINHHNGLQDFWGPLLAFSAAALVLQLITLGYCIQVFIRSLLDDKTTTDTSSPLPSYSGSVMTATARQTYRRVKTVIRLQWRGVLIVLLIITDVVFFSIVFVSMDNSTQVNPGLIQRAEPWLACLITSGGDKNVCLPKAKGFVPSEGVILAVLIVLGLSGIWNLIFLGRWSMVLGWIDLFKTRQIRRHEFVSADARRLSNDPRTYEMLSSPTMPTPYLKSPERAVLSPSPSRHSPFLTDTDSKSDYFSPAMSICVNTPTNYSRPRTPPSSGYPGWEWDPGTPYANSGASPVEPSTGRKIY